MNRPTPITEYRSAPSSPRVAKPHNEPRAIAPTTEAAKHITNHFAAGVDQETLATLMAARCKSERHYGRAPSSHREDNGGKGQPRANVGHLRQAVLSMLTPEWRKLDVAMIAALGRSDKAIRDTLCDLRDAGKVDHRRSMVGSPSMWRLKQ